MLFAIDVAREVSLPRAAERLAAEGLQQPIAPRHKHRAALDADLPTPPLRAWIPVAPERVGSAATADTLELSLYDFGALALSWRIPFEASLEELVALSAALYANETLAGRARAVALGVLESLGDAARSPGMAAEVEDYVLFHVPAGTGALPERADLARLLRAEQGALSQEEQADALSVRCSYRDEEACLVDWLAAVLAGSEMDDERRLLEYATVELLELRFLDAVLLRGIENAYVALSRSRRGLSGLAVQSGELERLARLQADNAALRAAIEHVSERLGDDYLARCHRAAAERFHFAEWDASIERKLRVLGSIHGQLSDLAWRRRSELLEWIIIVLIAADIVLLFTPLR